MRELTEHILRIEWEQVRWGRALSGLVSMLAVVAFAGAIDDVLLAALLGTLFVTAAGSHGTMSQRLPGMVRFTLFGALLGGLAFASVDSALAVAVVLGVATYAGTLAAAAGPTAARAGLYLTLWPLFALLFGSTDTEPWAVAVAFLAGGAIAVGVTAIRLRFAAGDDAAIGDAPDVANQVAEESLSRADQLVAAMASPIGWFALLRAAAVALGVVLGFWWFDSYPFWVAITVIVVVKPSADQSAAAAVERTLGTAVGVGLAVVIAQILPESNVAVAIAFLASGFLMLAFSGGNYTLFAAFLTAMLVFGQRLVQADAFEAGWQRLLATAVGALIGFAVVGTASRLRRPPLNSDGNGLPEASSSAPGKEENRGG